MRDFDHGLARCCFAITHKETRGHEPIRGRDRRLRQLAETGAAPRVGRAFTRCHQPGKNFPRAGPARLVELTVDLFGALSDGARDPAERLQGCGGDPSVDASLEKLGQRELHHR